MNEGEPAQAASPPSIKLLADKFEVSPQVDELRAAVRGEFAGFQAEARPEARKRVRGGAIRVRKREARPSFLLIVAY